MGVSTEDTARVIATMGEEVGNTPIEGTTMRHTIKLAIATVTVAIGAGVGFAPVASATTTDTHPKAPSTTAAPAPPQYETGTDPLVPTNTGALPYVLIPHGD